METKKENTKKIVLEEEVVENVPVGIPVKDLIDAGAQRGGSAGYLILNGKIYEPVKWGIVNNFDELATSVGKGPTHYRQRGVIAKPVYISK